MSDSNNTNKEGMSENCIKTRKIMTKEKIHKRLDNSIRASEIIIAKEQGRVGALKFVEGILDEYFEKTGHWIKHDGDGHYDCSLCGCGAICIETADKLLWKLSNYCPDCGAKMENGGECHTEVILPKYYVKEEESNEL